MKTVQAHSNSRKRRYAQAARDFGCDEAESKRWVTALMRKLRALVVEAD